MKQEEPFNDYTSYRQYVKEEWNDGYINELFECGYIVEKEYVREYECASRAIEYRMLTESEFNETYNSKKMKANELMIGNWVRRRESDTYIQVEEYFFTEELYNYQPIAIKEDWLLKLGFEKTMSWTYAIELSGNLKLVYYLGEKGWSIGFKSYSDFSSVQYVHQLQNLYFALTGKELTLNTTNTK